MSRALLREITADLGPRRVRPRCEECRRAAAVTALVDGDGFARAFCSPCGAEAYETGRYSEPEEV